MKLLRIVIIIISTIILLPVLSSCGSNKRVLVIDCPTEKPSEYNKEGFKNEKERSKRLDKANKSRSKERR